MPNPVKPIPQGYHTVTPHLIVKDAPRAIEFYKKAFNAQELARMPGPDGKIVHAELKIGDSIVMLCDEFPEMGNKSPQTLGGTPLELFMYFENVDEAWDRAVKAGATSVMPLSNQFWGDRYGKLKDPFGHGWAVAQHVEDVSPEEMKKRHEEFNKQMAGMKK
jgi:PhnB protein